MFSVSQCTPQQAFELYERIPEFDEKYPWSKWESRLDGKEVLAFCAFAGNLPIGIKVGYFEEDHFYSWIGGVLPEWRRAGVAKMLADEQEEALRARGVKKVRMKTRNRYKPMLLFALESGFDVVETYPDPAGGSLLDTRIVLEKMI